MSKMTPENSTPGSYKFRITEHGLGLSSKDKPQVTLRLLATAKWVETPDEMTHFGIEEPAWVDWSANEDEIILYAVLFSAIISEDEQCIPTGPNKNTVFWYESLCEAR